MSFNVLQEGSTPLHGACGCDTPSPAVFKILIEEGADVEAVDNVIITFYLDLVWRGDFDGVYDKMLCDLVWNVTAGRFKMYLLSLLNVTYCHFGLVHAVLTFYEDACLSSATMLCPHGEHLRPTASKSAQCGVKWVYLGLMTLHVY